MSVTGTSKAAGGSTETPAGGRRDAPTRRHTQAVKEPCRIQRFNSLQNVLLVNLLCI